MKKVKMNKNLKINTNVGHFNDSISLISKFDLRYKYFKMCHDCLVITGINNYEEKKSCNHLSYRNNVRVYEQWIWNWEARSIYKNKFI